MSGNIDEMSHAIGGLRSDVKTLFRKVEDSQREADKRHRENTERLDGIERTLAPLAKTVESMQPIVEGYQVTRWKAIGGLSVLVFLGWLVSLVAGKLFTWLLSQVVR